MYSWENFAINVWVVLRDRTQIDSVPALITEPANLPGLSQLPAATQLLSREAAFYSVPFYTPSDQRVLYLLMSM